MKKFNLFGSISIFALLFLIANPVSAQNVGIGTNTPNPAAKLEVTSTNSGFLPPRMTFAERNAIVNPVQGLMIYCTDCGSNEGEPQYFNGTSWLSMMGGPAKDGPGFIPSVTIGTQVWSSKNLDVATYRNGDPIPQVTDPTQWANLTTGAWCWYNNDSATYGTTYGRLYNWYAVNDPRGLAPQGWHVPSEADWNMLTKYLDPNADTATCCTNVAGPALKSTSGWQSNGNGNNISGFTGRPGGLRNPNGTFDYVGGNGYWWSANDDGTANANLRSLYHYVNFIFREYLKRTYGFSTRLVRD